ncbi:MAG TPA: YceI family protein [Flavobacterium sp.]|nr:YceI family protein [Flavobacterium sp.]
MEPLHWELDKAQSQLKFKIERQLLPDIKGQLNFFKVSIVSSDFELSNAKVDMSVDVYSLDTNDDDHDELLKSNTFFDADNFPEIFFRSTAFTKISGDDHSLVGDLTFAGVTKQVIFNADFGGQTKDGFGNSRIKLGFNGIINRKDFMTVHEQHTTFKLSNELHLHADLQFVKRY